MSGTIRARREEELSQRIDALLALAAWGSSAGGEGGVGYDRETCAYACDCALWLWMLCAEGDDQEGFPVPSIAAGPHGTVNISWQLPRHYLLVNVSNDSGNRTVAYVGYSRNGVDVVRGGGPFGLVVDDIVAYLRAHAGEPEVDWGEPAPDTEPPLDATHYLRDLGHGAQRGSLLAEDNATLLRLLPAIADCLDALADYGRARNYGDRGAFRVLADGGPDLAYDMLDRLDRAYRQALSED